MEAWREADRSVGRQLDALLAGEPDLTPYEVAGAVARAIAPGMQLVVGASSPVRDLDLMMRPTGVGERRKTIANRGLAGIDGTVSTAIGAALGRDQGPTIALMGDVTFLHDSNGLVLGPREPRPDLTIVVVNDDGGSIFTDARARRSAPTPTGSTTSSGRRTGSTWRRSAPPPGPRTCGSAASPSWSRPWPRRTAASRWSRYRCGATTGASSTRGSARSARVPRLTPGGAGGGVR